MEMKKRRQKSCIEIALARARQARRQKKHPIQVGWVFIAALLSLRTSVMPPATPYRAAADNDWPISDYERGYSTVTVRLLPWRICLDAGDDLFVIDKAFEEFLPICG